MRYAEIVVDAPLSSGNERFDYIIPDALKDEVKLGSRVLVPFGKRNLEGYVIHLKESSEVERVKEILEVLDEEPPLNAELIELGKYMSERYLCPLFLSLQAMVPASLRSKYIKWIEWNKEKDDFPLIVLPEEEKLLTYIKEKGEVERKRLLKSFPAADEILERFISKGFLLEKTRAKDESGEKKEKVVRLLASPDEAGDIFSHISARAAKQREILAVLRETPVIPVRQLLSLTKATQSTLLRLQEMGMIQIEEQVVRRDPLAERNFPQDQARILTEEQRMVYERIVASIRNMEQKSYLLHGVTGSGKTEIYLQIIQYVLAQGREAIVLVPEISLTPLMVERFKSRFGENIAVLHSGLSAGEKLDEWRRIRRGEAKVVVGARSAIFAPVKKLGIIIVDEEHESTYKQEETPRYHVRDLALKRATYHQSVVVFGSATPSLESYAFAKAGRFHLLEMKHRVNDQPLPLVHLVDMREEMKAGHRHIFSRLLFAKIEERLRKKEQIVLLLNRRGYSTFVICRNCGYTAECPHCDISLTYHQTNHTIRCHYCGHAEKMLSQCPKCESPHIRFFGTGTQKVEEELGKQFPGIRVIRMDLDTTSRKGAHEKLLASFSNHEADVLLGTQMIAKGLDFPKVSLVGVITADTMLHLTDFRAAERTFQLITQVAGRAGRHEIPGEVVVQSYTPEHYSIRLGVKQDFKQFFNHEIGIRKKNNYPPFYRLCLIHFIHEESPILVKALGRFTEELRIHLSEHTTIYGPVPSSIQRINDRYRYHCMIKYKDEPKLNQTIKRALHNIEDLIQKHKILVSIDIDPQYLL